MRSDHYKILTLILLAGLFVSCSPFKPELRKDPQGALPEVYSIYSETGYEPGRWWETFNDERLNLLVAEALSGNFSVREAWSRLKQARASAVQAGASLYPQVSASGGSTSTRQRTENGSVANQSSDTHSLGLVANYELDLWGKLRSEKEAAVLEADATREDLNTAAMTVAAEVALRWVGIISQRMQRALLENQLKINETYYELVMLRFRNAMVSALDVYQQKQVIEQVKAEIPLVEQEEQLLRHELALLLGKAPLSRLDIDSQNLPTPIARPPAGIPADLLANRPDVRAAGYRLQAADHQVAAARADRLPSISLSAEALYGPAALDLLMDNWMLSLAGNLAAPIIDGNRRAAEVDRTRAVVDENLLSYRETVLTAIKEVEDALVSEDKQKAHLAALELQIGTARKALDQARERYRKGLNTYLPVLTQLLTVQNLERDLIRQQEALLVDRINLYRALGGDWTDDLTAFKTMENASTDNV